MDIRKMLEKQLEILQTNSEMPMEGTAPAENTFAMLEIIDVLYPEGIPERAEVAESIDQDKKALQEIANSVSDKVHTQKTPSLLSMEVKLDTDEIANEMMADLEKKLSIVFGKRAEVDPLKHTHTRCR